MIDINTINAVKIRTRLFVAGGFDKAYRSLPYTSFKHVRIAITENCSWSRSTFDKKERGESPFSLLEINYITELFKSYNLNAWTGEPLNNKS